MISMPLSVQLLAMSPSSQRTISGFIKTKGKKHFSLTESSSPEVLLIDIDNPQGKQYLSQFQYGNASIITLSLSKHEALPAHILQIKKPITGVELIRSAEKIVLDKHKSASREVTRSSPQNTKDETLEKSHKTASSSTSSILQEDIEFYDPSPSLQGMLRKAIQLSDKENSTVVMTIQKYQLEINARNHSARLNFPKSRLRTLCQFPLSDHTCSIKKGLMVSITNKNLSMSLTELSWNAAIFCSRGRLPKNFSNQVQYHLKSWPNVTRWNCPEHTMKMASLWSKHPNTIQHISQQLSIPLIHVHSFITAAMDSHLAVQCNERIDAIPFDSKRSNSALFRKLLNRLKRA